MRTEVVDQLVLASVDARLRTDRGVTTVSEKVFQEISTRLTASLLTWFVVATTIVVAAALVGWNAKPTSSNSRLVFAGASAAFASLFVIGMPALLRSQHFARNQIRINAIESIFETHRVNCVEWDAAKLQIRRNNPDLLGYGVSRRFDDLCLP